MIRHLRAGCRSAVALSTFFTLAVPASAHVDLDAPFGGETLICGSTFSVQWHVVQEHDTANWDLYYSVDGIGGPWVPIALDIPKGDTSTGAVHTFAWTVPDSVTSTARVRVVQDNGSQDYEGVSGTDFAIVPLGQDLGFGKVGGNGETPALSAHGDLGPGGAGTLTLEDAPASTAALIVVGLQSNPTAFGGGLLVPVPIALVVPLTTDPAGGFALPIPGGVGPATIVTQVALADAGASEGTGLSNALALTWP